jgi:YggT family protein
VLGILQLIIDTAAGVLGGVLLLRFWMQAIRVRPPAQVGQFTFTLTDWLVRPMRRLVPGVGGFDWASLIGAFLVVLLANSIRFLDGWPGEAVVLGALFRFLNWIIYGFMAPFIHALNDPLLRPLRRVIPPIGGIDLSVLVALILLQVIQMVIGRILF